MSKSNTAAHLTLTSSVVVPHSDHGDILSNESFGESPELVMDIYYPKNHSGRTPAVLLITGFSDEGYEKRMGMKLKEVMWYVSWAKLLASSGLIAITYSNNDPATDPHKLVSYLEKEGERLGVDTENLAVMAQSANAVNGIAMAHALENIICAVMLYGYMPDIGDLSLVSGTLRQFGMSIPQPVERGQSRQPATLIVRAGKEEHENLNASIDLYLRESLAQNEPCSFINYPEGIHCFDILDNSIESQRVIEKVIQHFKLHLNL